MNKRLYLFGIQLIGFLQSVGFLNGAVTAFARVWLRHQKLRAFLVSSQFDGVIDGGANVGEFAEIVRTSLPSAHLVCVEPHAASAAILREKGLNVVEAALWKERTRLKLSQPTAATTSCTVLDTESTTTQGTWEVEALRLEDIQVQGKKIFLKLDLQGAELQALEGMGHLWERCTAIILEVSFGEKGTHSTLVDFLATKGFREYSTPNELEVDGRVVEADKIFLRK